MSFGEMKGKAMYKLKMAAIDIVTLFILYFAMFTWINGLVASWGINQHVLLTGFVATAILYMIWMLLRYMVHSALEKRGK